MKDVPIVTVCVATYNREKLLLQVWKTLTAQTFKAIEIIFVDDGSTDGTINLLKELQKNNKQIKIFRHEKNKGLAAARNTAIKHAQGKYFTFIDDDDAWSPYMIEECVKIAEAYDENWCFCVGSTSFVFGTEVCSVPELHGSLILYIKAGYTPPVAAQFYRTETLREVDGYNEQIKSGVDHDLWLKLAFHGTNIASIPKCLAYPNRNAYEKRMTTDTQMRLHEIKTSLQIWRPDIVNNIGEEFYKHFYRSYMFHLYRSFVINALRKNMYRKAYQLLKDMPQDQSKLIMQLVKRIGILLGKKVFMFWKKDTSVYTKMKPSFFPFNI